jgi:hypothetical protein
MLLPTICMNLGKLFSRFETQFLICELVMKVLTSNKFVVKIKQIEVWLESINIQ